MRIRTIASRFRAATMIALLGLAAAGGGCSAEQPASSADGGANAAGMGWTASSFGRDHCSTPTRSDVPECMGTFCAPRTLDIEVRSDAAGASWKCSGYAGAEQCQGNDVYQAYILELPAIYLYVSFDPAIVRERDGEAVVRHFSHLWMNYYFPDRRADGVHEQVTFHKGDKAIKRFELRGDLLEIEIEPPPADQAAYDIQSRDDDCNTGDIAGMCHCPFALPDVPVRVKATLDLRAAIPGG
jgi:hypothetical protein